MPLYEIVWTETSVCTAYVRADSESAARQSWIDDNLASSIVRTVTTSHLDEIHEMPGRHDRLCCCPTCEGA